MRSAFLSIPGPFVAAATVLRSLVEEHVADEEENPRPALRQAATDRRLDEHGGRILQLEARVG